MDGAHLKKLIAIICCAMLMPMQALAYTGSGGIWAMKSGDFVARNFSGNQSGIQSALDYVGSTGGVVSIAPGTYTITSPIRIPGNTVLHGTGRAAVTLEASSSFSGTAMVMPSDTTGSQQWFALENLTVDGNSDGGATVARGVLLKGIGQPTCLNDVTVIYCSGVGIWREGISTNVANIQIFNTGVAHSGHHNILVTGQTGMLSLIDVDSEDPGAGSAAVMLDGVTSSFYPMSIFIQGLHIEGLSSGEVGLLIDDTQNVFVDGLAYYGSGATGTLVQMTGSAGTCRGIVLRNIMAVGSSVANVIDDQVRSISLDNANTRVIPLWTTDKGTHSKIDLVNATVDSLSVGRITGNLVSGSASSNYTATLGPGGSTGSTATVNINSSSDGTTLTKLALQRNASSDWLVQGNGTIESMQFRHALQFANTSGTQAAYLTTDAKFRVGSSGTPTKTLEVGGVASVEDTLRVAGVADFNSNVIQFKGADVASTAAMTLGVGNVFTITGTADITSITARPAGTIVVLIFSGAAATTGLTDGSNLVLAGNFGYTANDTITLVSDGTNWIETGRSVN